VQCSARTRVPFAFYCFFLPFDMLNGLHGRSGLAEKERADEKRHVYQISKQFDFVNVNGFCQSLSALRLPLAIVCTTGLYTYLTYTYQFHSEGQLRTKFEAKSRGRLQDDLNCLPAGFCVPKMRDEVSSFDMEWKSALVVMSRLAALV